MIIKFLLPQFVENLYLHLNMRKNLLVSGGIQPAGTVERQKYFAELRPDN